MAAEGQAGGPFTPNSTEYVVQNVNESGTISYEVTKTAPWITITNASGTLPALATATVTVSINSAADILGNGEYADVVEFFNLTDGDGDSARNVTLTIGVPTAQHEWTMDADPGWDTEGEWAWGQPAGSGGSDHGNPDPSSGYTGDNVYGYNLAGDYTDSMSEMHLTSAAIDCSELTNVSVKFWRYLNVEQPSYDHAYFRISTDGSNWQTIWENGEQITDSAWSQQVYDLSEIADNEATLYLRWTMGSTDSSWRYSGWNVDDVEVWGLPPGGAVFAAGDMNCDGAVNSFDIDPFVLAMSDAAAYAAEYPDCNMNLGDMNDDGAVNAFDIDPFVANLTGN